MAAILDFRSCDIWEHFYVHRWIDHTPKHGIRHQHQLSRLNNTKVMRVFNFGYFGWRPYWIWPKKVPSRFFPPGILIDLVNRPPKENNYVGFKTIPIFSRSNSIFMRLWRKTIPMLNMWKIVFKENWPLQSSYRPCWRKAFRMFCLWWTVFQQWRAHWSYF